MNVYKLTADDLGISALLDSTIMPDGIEWVNDPGLADLFWCPTSLFALRNDIDVVHRVCDKFDDRLCVFADVSDIDHTYDSRALFIRCNARNWMLKSAPNTKGFAWPVDPRWADFAEHKSESKWDVGFVGWASQAETRLATLSCLETGLACRFTVRDTFYGYVERDNPELAAEQWQEHEECMRESRLQLCVESIPGVFRYRIWESLAAGRVPVCFGLESAIYPFAGKWEPNKCMFVLPMSQAQHAGPIVRRILETHDDDKLREMGQYGHEVWARWCDRRKWSALARELAIEHLETI